MRRRLALAVTVEGPACSRGPPDGSARRSSTCHSDYLFDGSLDQPWRRTMPSRRRRLRRDQARASRGPASGYLCDLHTWVTARSRQFRQDTCSACRDARLDRWSKTNMAAPTSTFDIAERPLHRRVMAERTTNWLGPNLHFAVAGETNWGGPARAIFSESARRGGGPPASSTASHQRLRPPRERPANRDSTAENSFNVRPPARLGRIPLPWV